jgi:glycosyltransferase involved in cell wall biosynthesis
LSAPKISVIIPSFNREKYILETLESVYAQSYTDYEVIVVDDGSTDGSKKLLAPLIKERGIRLLEQENAGVSAARNRGVEMAKGALIAFLDSDDIFQPQKLEKQSALLDKNPQLGFVHSNFSKFDDSGQELGLRDMSRFRGNVYPWILQEWSYLMALPTLLMPKKIFDELGGFDENIHWGEDIDLYFRVAKKYEIDMLPEVLCKVRVHPGSASASKIGSAESFHRVLDKAVAAAPALPKSFVRKAYAKLYVNKSQNILVEGNASEIRIARQLARKALGYRPLALGAWIALIGSLLPASFRRGLVSAIRKLRYPSPQA